MFSVTEASVKNKTRHGNKFQCKKAGLFGKQRGGRQEKCVFRPNPDQQKLKDMCNIGSQLLFLLLISQDSSNSLNSGSLTLATRCIASHPTKDSLHLYSLVIMRALWCSTDTIHGQQLICCLQSQNMHVLTFLLKDEVPQPNQLALARNMS